MWSRYISLEEFDLHRPHTCNVQASLAINWLCVARTDAAPESGCRAPCPDVNALSAHHTADRFPDYLSVNGWRVAFNAASRPSRDARAARQYECRAGTAPSCKLSTWGRGSDSPHDVLDVFAFSA